MYTGPVIITKYKGRSTVRAFDFCISCSFQSVSPSLSTLATCHSSLVTKNVTSATNEKRCLARTSHFALRTYFRAMRFTLTTLALLISILLTAQAPALIPYQAIARDGAGQPLSDEILNARFTIHNESANGTVVWQEVQTLNTNGLGLFTSQLGGTSSLAAVNWAVGSKFLQVELDLGNGFVEIGTQQMVSVPYALHAGNVQVDFSQTGDTLFIGEGSFVIIPGLSEANGFTTGTTLHSCGVSGVHNPNKVYGTMTDQEGNTYKTIVIGTQEWMAENLNTSIYRNGDTIPTNLDNTAWVNTTAGAWAYYNNDPSYACPYGKLYNWNACVDARQLCPVGWHVPSDAELTILSNYLGGDEVSGGKMKAIGTVESGTGYWRDPNTSATNESGFSGLPGGGRNVFGNYVLMGNLGYLWSASQDSGVSGWNRYMAYTESILSRNPHTTKSGFSVRCLRD